MNTFTHKPVAALLLLGSLLCSLPDAVGATAASAAASAAAGNTATPGSTNTNSSASASASMIAASAPVNGIQSSAGASTVTGTAASTAHPAVNKHAGVNLGSSTHASGVGSVFQIMSALILVVIIMLGLAWGLKNFGPKRLLGRVPVQVVGAANLGGRERVLVIEVADQWIVIGATPNSITTLATLPRQSLDDEELQPGKPFSDWLKQIMEKRNG